MGMQMAVVILSIIALAVSAFSAGCSMANWHFSNTFVRDKVTKKLEEELRWRLHLNKEMANETTETIKDAMDK